MEESDSQERARRRHRWQVALSLLALVAAACWFTTANAARPLQTAPDSASYLCFDFSSARAALTDFRTPGYPAFLKFAGWLSPNLQGLAALHAIVLGLSVVIFWIGLQCHGFTPWSALAVSAPLFLVGHFQRHVATVLADFLGAALVIAAMGAMLIALSRPRRVTVWLGLGAAVFAVCLVRPAYLFLVLLVPLLGPLLLLVKPGRQGWGTLLRTGAFLFLACVVPLSAFAAVRWATVGHFGLVSFGGMNSIGIALEMLDEDGVGRLPPPLRPFAFALVHERERWEGDRVITARAVDTRLLSYNRNVWRVAAPVAAKFDGDDLVRINRRCNQTSVATFAAGRSLYFRWLAASWPRAVNQGFSITLEHTPFLKLSVLILGLYVVTFVLAKRTPGGVERANVIRRRNAAEMSVAILIAGAVLLAQTLLTVLVEPPLERYASPAAIFLPAIFYLAAWHMLRETGALVALHAGHRRILTGEQDWGSGEDEEAFGEARVPRRPRKAVIASLIVGAVLAAGVGVFLFLRGDGL